VPQAMPLVPSDKNQAVKDPAVERVGEIVAGRYEILRLIGQGGMGSVYEVQHLALRRSFALKLLMPDQVQNAESLARFRQEAGVIAALRHPNIVEIVDWLALSDGTPGMLMEFLRGQSLHALLRTGPLPWQALAAFGDQLVSALAVAHKAGIIHRDLKPANVFVVSDEGADERIKLLDFGVSKIAGTDKGLTTAGYVLGSPPYMSPEQLSSPSDKLGPATDLWSTGALLYEMATGKRAFNARNLGDLAEQIRTMRPPPITTLRPDAPAAFVAVIDSALTIDPARRVGSANELRRALAASLKPLLRSLPSVAVEQLQATRIVTTPVATTAPRASDEPLTARGKGPHANASPVTAETGDAPHGPSSREIELVMSAPYSAVQTAHGKRGRAWTIAASGILGFSAAAAVLYGVRPPPADKPAAPLVARVPATDVEPATPAAVAHTDFAAPTAPPSSTRETKAPPLMTTLTLTGVPSGAKLFLDEKPVRGELLLPYDDSKHMLKIVANGYRTASIPVAAATASPLLIRLEKHRPTRPSGSANDPPMLDP